MSSRSRLWWAAALTISAAGAAYILWLPERFFAFSSFGGGFCPGQEFYFWRGDLLGNVDAFLLLQWYGGAPAVAIGFAVHWLSTRLGRPCIGRVTARAIAAIMLVLFGASPLAFVVDIVADRDCVAEWGGPLGVWFFLDWTVAPTIAALCVLAAVRRPRHRPRTRLRTLVRARRTGRIAVGVLVLAVLGLVSAADFGSGPVTTPDRCPPVEPDGGRMPTGESAFLCAARHSGAFTTVPDDALLAYGRKLCAAYPRVTGYESLIAPICPPAASGLRREIAAQEAEFARREAADQAVCDRSRHRPRIKPVRVARTREFSEIGMESYEDHEDTTQQDPVIHGDLVGSAPGRLSIYFHADFEVCVTTEAYRRRPPVEVKGWDKVIEVGYQSPSGDLVLRDPMASPELPNLAIAGKGHYRVRVHFRKSDNWQAFTRQHLLIMVYPGRGDQITVLKG